MIKSMFVLKDKLRQVFPDGYIGIECGLCSFESEAVEGGVHYWTLKKSPKQLAQIAHSHYLAKFDEERKPYNKSKRHFN